jgi:hypothetical protein
MSKDHGYKNVAGQQAFTFDESLAMARQVFDAYGATGASISGMSGNMICDLVNLAAIRAEESRNE